MNLWQPEKREKPARPGREAYLIPQVAPRLTEKPRRRRQIPSWREWWPGLTSISPRWWKHNLPNAARIVVVWWTRLTVRCCQTPLSSVSRRCLIRLRHSPLCWMPRRCSPPLSLIPYWVVSEQEAAEIRREPQSSPLTLYWYAHLMVGWMLNGKSWLCNLLTFEPFECGDCL